MSSVALFAADAIAERLGATRPRRALLAAASAIALWSVSVPVGPPRGRRSRWDCCCTASWRCRRPGPRRSAWLVGAAVAVQPLVLVALPVLLVIIEPRRLAGFLARAAAPGVVLLAAAAAANWSATIHAVTNQPNWPTVDHPTPWTSLAPHLADGAVAAGPGRVLAIVVACGCAIIVGRAGARRGGAAWSPETLEEVLWWTAAVLALRSVFERVMVAYYLWPVLAVALIAAVRSWPRLAATSVAAVTITFVSQVTWHGPWSLVDAHGRRAGPDPVLRAPPAAPAAPPAAAAAPPAPPRAADGGLSAAGQAWMTSVWWQKCTRAAPVDRIRASESRQATGSARLAGRQVLVGRALVHLRRVGGVPDQQVGRAAVGRDDHALVAHGVPGRRDHRQAGQHLGVPVEQLEPRVHEVEPVVELRRLALGPAQFGALDVAGGVLEHGVLAAVVEVQVSVDHQADVARGHVQVGERVRDRAVDHPPVAEQLVGPADAGVHQHRAAGVGDHEAVHRPLPGRRDRAAGPGATA